MSLHYLYQLLKQLGYNIELQVLHYLTKYCKHCQKYSQSPRHFTYTLKSNRDFDYNVIINVMYIEKKPVLYLIDGITQFQAGH